MGIESVWPLSKLLYSLPVLILHKIPIFAKKLVSHIFHLSHLYILRINDGLLKDFIKTENSLLIISEPYKQKHCHFHLEIFVTKFKPQIKMVLL